MWDLSGPRLHPYLLHWAGRFFTTESLGKPLSRWMLKKAKQYKEHVPYPHVVHNQKRETIKKRASKTLINWNFEKFYEKEEAMRKCIRRTQKYSCPTQANNLVCLQTYLLAVGRNWLRKKKSFHFSSIQFSCSVVSDSLQPHGLQHRRPRCPSPTPGACSNSSPLSQWCHPTISSSVIPFSSCLQSFPASGYFLVNQLLVSGGQSIRASASSSVLPINIQDWFPLGLTVWISLQSKGLSRVFYNTTAQKHQFFSTQLSLRSNSHIRTRLLERPYLWLDGALLVK